MYSFCKLAVKDKIIKYCDRHLDLSLKIAVLLSLKDKIIYIPDKKNE